MRNGIWVIALAVEDGHGAEHSTMTPSLLREQLDLAAALAPRLHICAVLTNEQGRRLEDPLWFLPRSNVFIRPDEIGTAPAILLALLRILRSDPGARVVLLPSSQRARDEGSLLESLRGAAADVANGPENVILLSIEPDAAQDRIVVGRARALLKLFEPELTLPNLDFHRHVLPGAKQLPRPQTLPHSATEAL